MPKRNGKANGHGNKFKVGYPETIPIDPITGKKSISDLGVGVGLAGAAASLPLLWYVKKKKKEANEKAAKEGKDLPYPFTGKSPEKKQKGGEVKSPEAIKKMKKALNKLKPHLMGESVDAMTIIVEGEKKKRDKSISKSTQPYGAKKGGIVDTTKFRYI